MTTAPQVVIIRTGSANIASVVAGLSRAGASVRVGASEKDVRGASHVVLPGVGAFGAAMQEIAPLVPAIRDRMDRGLPTLAICLGLQLLCKESEESKGVRGLGVIEQRVTRFPAKVQVPQLGWNTVHPEEGCELLAEGYAYYANSFRLEHPPTGWKVAMSDHGGPFVAAMEKGAILACQFHPELSGAWGRSLLTRWLARGPGLGEAPLGEGASC